MINAGQMTLDEMTAEDPVVRAIMRAVRDGRGMTLEQAAEEVGAIVQDADRVEAAKQRIVARLEYIRTAQVPRAVVSGNTESWYPGPRSEDHHWPALVELLRKDGWKSEPLNDLDDASTKIIAHLPNPLDGKGFHCRGLVLGYVQSGKTTNFTAVVAKAADAGYRFFIVLSGIHNALREQTQSRLNEQLWEPHPDLWHNLTVEDDFRPSAASVDALLSTQNQRVLAIVKKNGARLRALHRWLTGARPELLARCPILIIDDEADQASVNTAKPDRQPTRINKLVRSIVNDAPKAAYVGYTATPFANVLIDATNEEDLYPRDFIVDLPRPAVYVGPETIFGREPLQFDPDGVEDAGNDFIRTVPVEELEDLRPVGAAARHEFDAGITPSLDEALRYFLLSTATRRIRAEGNKHCTALIHTSQHIDVHEQTAQAIRVRLRRIRDLLATRDAGLIQTLEDQWIDECERVPAEDFDLRAVPWADVAAILPAVAADAEVIVDNSRSTERLSFDDSEPRVIIAVGGNTLSRGLTLEGLSVSFFVRSASAYDTLLQMGRWFGYRNGYLDLTRIWMTDEMREWFHHLATVEREIRYDIERYETEHETPERLGVRLRTHPKLAITAASKMQHARRADISYAGRRLQTILFNHRDAGWLRDNVDAGRQLSATLRDSPHSMPRSGIRVFGPVDSDVILDFLDGYRFHENSRDLDGKLIRKYIEGRRQDGELRHFKVALMGRGTASDYLGEIDLGFDAPIGCINRARLRSIGNTYADIKALMSHSDRVVDLGLSLDELKSAVSNGDIGRLRNRPSEGGQGDGTGLLLLYPVSKDSRPLRPSKKPDPTREPLDAVEHVLGVGLVFPETKSRSASVDYVTSNIAALSTQVETPDDADDLHETEADVA